ncbi:transmembrane and coiled-coil domains protein 2-like [Watersipora subatra]|uniref:transmembrane and coiled-coil domains protein 2-like n=1 Tax=Watersipora subatra TaxID=2589382 RepID=UPI00355C3A1E
MVKSITDMRKFEFGRSKRSPIPGKKPADSKGYIETEDGNSDYADSEHGGSTDAAHDVLDTYRSSPANPSRTKEAQEALKHKVDKIKMDIQREQRIKEEHVEEYLDLSSKAGSDEAKNKNVKIVFEKNNSVSAQKIASLQKRLERYNNELKKLEQHGASSHRAAKEVLKDVGLGLKEFGGSVVGNIRTATDALVSKPKDHSSGSVSGKSKSGSIDNLTTIPNVAPLAINESNSLPARAKTDSPISQTGSTTLPANFKLTVSGSKAASENDMAVEASPSLSDGSYQAVRESPHASSASPSVMQTLNTQAFEPIMQKLNVNANNLDRMVRELDAARSQMEELADEMSSLRLCVEEERMADKYDRLEEHLNDFVELTQNELSNLKQELSNMEEKMDYQLEERTRDLHDALDNANTKIAKMEHQNQHQQLINMEGVDNPNAKMFITKLINVVLALLAVVLVIVSTISNITGPFLNAKWKFIFVVVFAFIFYITSSHWEIVTSLAHPKPPDSSAGPGNT